MSVREPSEQQDRPLGRGHHGRRHGSFALGEAEIVVEVSFVEWTRDGLLRHPEFVGVRDDKSPREVSRERD